MVNATEGVLAGLNQRITHSSSFTESILYLLLLDPAAPLQRTRAWDPATFHDAPAGRAVSQPTITFLRRRPSLKADPLIAALSSRLDHLPNPRFRRPLAL